MYRNLSRFWTISRRAAAGWCLLGILGLFGSLGMFACGEKTQSESRPITPSVALNKPRAPIGSPIEISYRFDVGPESEPLSKDYTVFVHFLDSRGALLFIDDHLPPEPTSSWQAGSTVEYKRTLFIPLYPYLGTASIVAGLYIPETGDRLGLEGTDNGHQAYSIGQVELLDQKENIFLVYKEGWHQLESDPANPTQEWQWTKKDAVCSFRNPKKESLLYLDAETTGEAFEEPLEVAILMGENEIAKLTVGNRELKKIPVPASALGTDDWVDLRIVNREFFVPKEKGIGDDTRELGLRVYHLYIETFPGT